MNKDLLHTYFKGESTPDEEKRIMDWSEASPENLREYLHERKLWNAVLVNYPRKDRLHAASGAKSNSFSIWKLVGVAASIALVFSLSWTLFNLSYPERGGQQSVIVPAGQRVKLILEDGTKVWLNSNSSFTYPTSFGNESREVVLDGEGFFEVTKNTRKPFIVKTKKYDIKVLGTTFNVYAYDHDSGTFETSLLNGSVDVSSKENKENHIILKTKEKVCEVNGLLHREAIDNLDRFRWKDGLICLDDVPFDALMKKFSIYYDITIKIDNPKVSDYRCTGKFRQSDGIEYALRVIQRDLRFEFIRDDETNTIIIK